MTNEALAKRASILRPMCMGLGTLTAVFLVMARWYANYLPFGDDPAVIGASAANLKDWFRFGFSRIFITYPEWAVPYTDFVRPGVNAILRLDHILFGNLYFIYFLLFYAGQLLLIWIVVRLARDLGVKGGWLLLLAFLLAIEPAFCNEGLVALSFQFDAWSGLFSVVAFLLLVREQFAPAVIVLTLAVFTKEPALYAPVAAALTAAYATRRFALSGLMLTPLAAWFLVRKFVFTSFGLKGVYALGGMSSVKELLVGIVKGMLRWPTGLIGDSYQTHPFQLSDLFHLPGMLIFLLGNLLLWALFLVIGIKLFRSSKPALLSPFTILIWTCGALSFGVLVGHLPRFGGSIYPLELLLLAIAGSALPASIWRTASQAALCLMVPAFFWNIHTRYQIFERDDRPARETMSALMSALKDNGRRVDSIYVLNSAPSFAAPQYLSGAAGIPGRIVLLSQFSGCIADSRGTTAIEQTSASEIAITAQLPPCAKLEFDGAGPAVSQAAIGGFVDRGGFAKYSFPDEKTAGHGLTNAADQSLDLGGKLKIDLAGLDPQNSIILYYDWATGRYRCLGEKCAQT